MVDDAGWTSFKALHRLAAVATRSGGYKKRWLQEAVATRRRAARKRLETDPKKKRPGRWSWPLENFRRNFDTNH
jgi:hypothetical protein